MDALSDVLRAVQLSGAVFLNAELRAPWCVLSRVDDELCTAYLPPSDRIVSYHLVMEGECQAGLVADPGAALQLRSGELLVVPQGEEHLLGSSLDLPPATGTSLLGAIEAAPGEVMQVTYGGDGAATRLMCGFLTCDGVLSNPLLASLPRLFKVDVGGGLEWAWLRSTLDFAASEIAIPRAGTATVLAKLSELLFVQAIRHCVDSMPQNHHGWLTALHDRFVGRAMLKLHAEPARPWTVDELAQDVGLSRSALAQRFSELLGQPPMQYLTRWRLQLAARDLRIGKKSLAEVALTAGYDSEPAFSRAFKREFGLPPASWRSSQRSNEPGAATPGKLH